MGHYTLYAIKMGGLTETLTVHQCKDAVEAYERAEKIIFTDATVSAVEVWCRDKRVFTVKQQTEPLAA